MGRQTLRLPFCMIELHENTKKFKNTLTTNEKVINCFRCKFLFDVKIEENL